MIIHAESVIQTPFFELDSLAIDLNNRISTFSDTSVGYFKNFPSISKIMSQEERGSQLSSADSLENYLDKLLKPFIIGYVAVVRDFDEVEENI